jgi:hypothetical protein
MAIYSNHEGGTFKEQRTEPDFHEWKDQKLERRFVPFLSKISFIRTTPIVLPRSAGGYAP